MDPIVIPPLGSSPPMQICVTSPEVGCVLENPTFTGSGSSSPFMGCMLVDLQDPRDHGLRDLRRAPSPRSSGAAALPSPKASRSTGKSGPGVASRSDSKSSQIFWPVPIGARAAEAAHGDRQLGGGVVPLGVPDVGPQRVGAGRERSLEDADAARAVAVHRQVEDDPRLGARAPALGADVVVAGRIHRVVAGLPGDVHDEAGGRQHQQVVHVVGDAVHGERDGRRHGGRAAASQVAPIPSAARTATRIRLRRLIGGLAATPGLGFILLPSESCYSREAQPEQQCGSRLGDGDDRDDGVGREVVEGVAAVRRAASPASSGRSSTPAFTRLHMLVPTDDAIGEEAREVRIELAQRTECAQEVGVAGDQDVEVGRELPGDRQREGDRPGLGGRELRGFRCSRCPAPRARATVSKMPRSTSPLVKVAE